MVFVTTLWLVVAKRVARTVSPRVVSTTSLVLRIHTSAKRRPSLGLHRSEIESIPKKIFIPSIPPVQRAAATLGNHCSQI